MPELGDIDPAEADCFDYEFDGQVVRVADFGGYLIVIHKETDNWLLYFRVSDEEDGGRCVEQSFRVSLDDDEVVESYTGSDLGNVAPPAVRTALADRDVVVTG